MSAGGACGAGMLGGAAYTAVRSNSMDVSSVRSSGVLQDLLGAASSEEEDAAKHAEADAAFDQIDSADPNANQV